MLTTLRPGLGFRPEPINIISNFGGLGDMIARLPALRYMRDTFPHTRANVFWHDYFAPLAEHLLPSTATMVHRLLSDFVNANDKLPLIDFNPGRVASMGLHLIDHAFLCILERLPPVGPASHYIQASEIECNIPLPERPVVITCGNTASTREWLPEQINETARGLAKRGFTPVFLGNSNPQELGNKGTIQAKFSKSIDYSLGLNLINKTNLIDALSVIQQSHAVLGVDNGLLHLASCSRTPVIWGFTSVEAKYRVPYGAQNHRALEALVACSGCQSRSNFTRHDFRKCLFKDLACLPTMTAERFLRAFDSL